MKNPAIIVLVLLTLGSFIDAASAAIVKYTDENGKAHYVNTQYTKVPERYMGQVKDQLEKAAVSANPAPVNNLPNILPPAPETLQPKLTTAERQERLKAIIDKTNAAKSTGNLNPLINPVVQIIDRTEKPVTVTPENLNTVPKELLGHIDAQIVAIENLQKQWQSADSQPSAVSVEVYLKADCAACEQLQAFLQSQQIQYKRYDVLYTPRGKTFYEQQRHLELPIIRIGDKIISGVNIEDVQRALSANDNTAPSGIANGQL